MTVERHYTRGFACEQSGEGTGNKTGVGRLEKHRKIKLPVLQRTINAV